MHNHTADATVTTTIHEENCKKRTSTIIGNTNSTTGIMIAKTNPAVAAPVAAPNLATIPLVPPKTTQKTYIPITATIHRFRDHHEECCTLLKKSTSSAQSNPVAPAAARNSALNTVPKKPFQVAYHLNSTSRAAARKFTAKARTALTKIFHKYEHTTLSSEPFPR